MYFANHSRTRDMRSIWLDGPGADVDDVGDVNDVDADPYKDLDNDPISGNPDSDPDSMNLPELDSSMNGSRDEDDDVDEEVNEEIEDEEDEIRRDDDDCQDELEPLSKRKKTK